MKAEGCLRVVMTERKTVSFVATQQLADWLAEESESRMTTVSSAAQQLLVEKYREEMGEASRELEQDVFERHAAHWTVPDSDEYEYRVDTPDDDRRYYKTRDGAAKALRGWYE